MVAPHPRGQRKGLAAAEAAVATVEETEVEGYWSGEDTVPSLSLSPSLFPYPSLPLPLSLPLFASAADSTQELSRAR